MRRWGAKRGGELPHGLLRVLRHASRSLFRVAPTRTQSGQHAHVISCVEQCVVRPVCSL